MKPPIKNIDDLMEMWCVDAQMDTTEPGIETSKIPKLHSKYLQIMTHHSLMSKKVLADYNKMKKVKWEYYTGFLNNPEDLDHYGFEPLQKKIPRTEVPQHIDSDTDLINLLLKKAVHDEIVTFCTSVLKEINNRTWQLANIMKWEMYQGGK